MDVHQRLRQWLNSLNDDDLGVIVRVSHAIRSEAQLPGLSPQQAAQPVTRRELLAVRAWNQKADRKQLTMVAGDIVSHAAHVLITHNGFEEAVVDRPDLAQLTQLLVTLGYPIGKFTLFGLLVVDAFASQLAQRHEEELSEAVARAGRRPVPCSVWLGRQESEPPQTAAPLTESVVSDLAEQLATLRTLSMEIATALRDAATQLDDCALPTWPDSTSMIEFDAMYRDFVTALASLVDVPPQAGFDQFDALLAKLRAELQHQEEEEQEQQRKVDELRQTIVRLGHLLESTPDVAKDHLRKALAATEAELRSLCPDEDIVAAVPEAAPVALADLPDEQEKPAQPTVVVKQAPAVVDTMPEPEATADAAGTESTTPEPDDFAGTDLDIQEQRTQSCPWTDGSPSVVERLVVTGRLAEAYWVTAMSDEPDHRGAALRFASAAYGLHNNADATSVLAALDLQSHDLREDTDAAGVTVSAIVRAGLLAGWAPSMLNQLLPALSLPHRWAALVNAAADAIRHGVRIEDRLDQLMPNQDPDDARAELGRRAARLIEELPRRKNTYQRATHVMQLLLRHNQPLGAALAAVTEWSAGKERNDELAAVLAQFTGPEAVDALIENADAATRTPKQAREPIVASARRMMQRAIEEVSAVVHDACGVQHRMGMSKSGTEVPARTLAGLVAELDGAEQPPGTAGAAIWLLWRWLDDPDQVTGSVLAATSGAPTIGVPPMPTEPTTDVLLILPELPRTAAGKPDRNDPRTRSCLYQLVEPPSVSSAVSAYCERGDLPRARRTVELAADGYWPLPGDAPAVQRMQQTISSAADMWQRQYQLRATKANDFFARVRTQNLLDESDEASVSGRLQALSAVPDGAFDVAAAGLDKLTDELMQQQRSRIDEMRAELDSLQTDEPDRGRIVELLDSGDTVTAAEFLAFVRKGQPLPEDHAPDDQDLKGFVDLLGRGAPDGARVSAQAWAEAAANGTGLLPVAKTALAAWDSLYQSAGRGGDRMAGSVQNIIRGLGLNCTKSPRAISVRNQKDFRQFVVSAAPSDKSYVAMFGSAAKEYTIIVLNEERRSWSVADLVTADVMHKPATIVLSLRHMDLAARRQLAEQSAKTPIQALVVDPAMMGWVSAIAFGSWRATQRVALPWTGINPYTPFIAGLVPPEVFVGRDREIAEVTNPYGGLFVYGGRQLGKSALLRRVQATFGDGAAGTHVAVYLDLKGRGIGDAEPAARIWRELAVELQQYGIFSSRTVESATADTVVEQVRNWLSQNTKRRILFLADEADAFLTADSRSTQTAGGIEHFRNVLRLKELMESTDRAFKVVFAGLHQVQRFGHLSNVPLVHGGPDILVGPLAPQDAQQLVIEPMMALGYEFERPELVWRLLSATNYQASLIQIFCQELVTTLLRRRGQPKRSPVVVTENDVDSVSASDRVRRRITERLRITINLEDRYRVLALLIALQSLTDGFGSGYAPEELLQQARDQWSDGFKGMTVAQLDIYLDEMVGLGLLIKLSGQRRYAVRSPNVVNMIGTKADLEQELRETVFDLPYAYNPSDARRLLNRTDGVEHRSPLTDGQLSAIVSKGTTSLLAGTPALGIDRVPDAIRDYAGMRGGKVMVHKTISEIKRTLTSVANTQRISVIIADCLGKPLSEVESVARLLVQSQQGDESDHTAVLLVDPDDALEVSKSTGLELVRPDRWTVESLRSWPECPFDVPEARAALIGATGGWPDLVELTIARVMTKGVTQEQAIRDVRTRADIPERATEFLKVVGMIDALIDPIANWIGYGLEPVRPADLAEIVLEVPLGTVEQLLADLEVRGVLESSDDGVSLEPVVTRCLIALRARQ